MYTSFQLACRQLLLKHASVLMRKLLRVYKTNGLLRRSGHERIIVFLTAQPRYFQGIRTTFVGGAYLKIALRLE